MQRKIQTEQAPKAVGPYSQGVSVSEGHTLHFVSGQLPLDPKTGKLIEGDIRLATRQVIDNLEAILHAAGSSLNDVIRTDIFLIDLKRDFAVMNEEYATRFKGDVVPARQTIQVAALPLGAMVEISCIAARKKTN